MPFRSQHERMIIPISISSETWTPLVFDINAIEKLREWGILGVLSGSLPTAAQQNVFLTVPLRLMYEEAVWLVKSGYAYFILDNEVIQSNVKEIQRSAVEKFQRGEKVGIDEQYDARLLMLKEKLAKFGKTVTDTDRENVKQSVFIETRNGSSLIAESALSGFANNVQIQKFIVGVLFEKHMNVVDYMLFKSLREQSYFLSPGGRFGARYIAYPGDPLRYHSHLAVQPAFDYYEDKIDLLGLVCGGRLGTGVKKLWVLGGLRYKELPPEEETTAVLDAPGSAVSFFSIEWSGFG